MRKRFTYKDLFNKAEKEFSEVMADWVYSLTMTLSPILILVTIWYSHYLGKEKLNAPFWHLNALTALLPWLRMIVYLQSNKYMSFIISMVMISIVEMLPFIILLFIGVFAFGNAIMSVR